MKNLSALFKISTILWIIWGLVHVMAGFFTMKNILSDDVSSAISAIADAVDPEIIQMNYPDAAGAVIGQHGFNLFWAGIVTTIAAFYVWKGNKNAIFLAAMVGGCIDLGYFTFMDLGGYVKFVPGSVMTIICLFAIVLSFYAHFKNRQISTTI